MAHVGLTAARSRSSAASRHRRALSLRGSSSTSVALEAAGAFAARARGIPVPVAAMVTERLSIPTIGIGAGVDCDGQSRPPRRAGLYGDFKPKFAKRYGEIGPLSSMRSVLDSACARAHSPTPSQLHDEVEGSPHCGRTPPAKAVSHRRSISLRVAIIGMGAIGHVVPRALSGNVTAVIHRSDEGPPRSDQGLSMPPSCALNSRHGGPPMSRDSCSRQRASRSRSRRARQLQALAAKVAKSAPRSGSSTSARVSRAGQLQATARRAELGRPRWEGRDAASSIGRAFVAADDGGHEDDAWRRCGARSPPTPRESDDRAAWLHERGAPCGRRRRASPTVSRRRSRASRRRPALR